MEYGGFWNGNVRGDDPYLRVVDVGGGAVIGRGVHPRRLVLVHGEWKCKERSYIQIEIEINESYIIMYPLPALREPSH